MLRLCLNRSSLTSRIIAALLSYALLIAPVWAAPSSSLGTVVYADRAHVGAAHASVGATVFSGDRLSTEQAGSVQVRAGAARLLLSSESSATFSQDDAGPAATLTLGSATFSTANSNAFVLHVASAVIRPNTDQPTIGGAAYRVVLDPNAAAPQPPRGAANQGSGGPPMKAAKSKFIWYAIAATTVVTVWAFHEAFESPARP